MNPKVSRWKTLPGARKIALLIIIPLALALHVWLLHLGGVWRTFAIVEAAIGVFVALLIRDVKKLNGE